MPDASRQLYELSQRYPVHVDFIRRCPFGLIAEHADGGDVVAEPHFTYCMMSWGRSLSPEALLPGLIRLALAVESGYGVEARPGRTTYFEELLWFYAYARTQATITSRLADVLAPAVLGRWRQLGDDLEARIEYDALDYLRISILANCAVDPTGHMRGAEHPVFKDAWKAAAASPDFDRFYESYLSLGGTPAESERDGFAPLATPKKRLVVHECYGRIPGVLATTHVPWIGGPEGIRAMLRFCIGRPLLFENHDMDRPIALVHHPHLHETEDGHIELHADSLVFDAAFWSHRHEYTGFSLGLQHKV